MKSIFVCYKQIWAFIGNQSDNKYVWLPWLVQIRLLTFTRCSHICCFDVQNIFLEITGVNWIRVWGNACGLQYQTTIPFFNFNAIRLHKVVLECVWSAMKNNKGLCCKEGAKCFYELKKIIRWKWKVQEKKLLVLMWKNPSK